MAVTQMLEPHAGPWLAAVGRVLLASVFISGGLVHIFVRGTGVDLLKARKFPAPGLTVGIVTVFQFAVGGMFMLGYFITLAALALAVFTLLASVIAYNFWSMTEPPRQAAMYSWLLNIGLIGGLLIAASRGS